MFVASQISVALAIVCILISFQQKNKAWLLFWLCLSHIFQAVGFSFLGAWVGASLFFLSATRSLTFALLDKYEAKIPRWISVSILLAFLTAATVATIFTQVMWYDFVVLAAVLAFTYGCWAKGEHLVRVITVAYASVLIGYEILVQNWAGIILRSIYILAVAVYYIRKLKTKPPPSDKGGVQNADLSSP